MRQCNIETKCEKNLELALKSLEQEAKVLEALPNSKTEIAKLTGYTVTQTTSILRRLQRKQKITYDAVWKVMTYSPYGMTFTEAMEKLLDGKKVTCDSLQMVEGDSLGYYLEWDKNRKDIHIGMPHISVQFRMTKAMFLDRWVVVDEV